MITTSSIKLIYSKIICAKSSKLSALFINKLRMIQASFQNSSSKWLSSRTLYVILSMLQILKIYFLFLNDYYFEIIRIFFKNLKKIFFPCFIVNKSENRFEKSLLEKKYGVFWLGTYKTITLYIGISYIAMSSSSW